jgi:alkanesulfonate monooxygenase SsuD/methylene tetrahydromethanopterin reductase-like flavin-dependent oxidoreductase (luciferase family)
VKLIVHLNDFGWATETAIRPARLDDIASITEEGGFDGLAVADHLWSYPMVGGPETSCLEAYTTLNHLAARTRSVRLFDRGDRAHLRHPALLAKMVSTLDVLSGGRVWLGLGAGHYEEECIGLGVPFPPLSTRYELPEDALEVCLRMWSGEYGEDGPYKGHHVVAERLLNLPQVRQRPHHRCSLREPASAEPLRWSPATATPATCARPRTSPRSSMRCGGTANGRGRISSASSAPLHGTSRSTLAAPAQPSCSNGCSGSPAWASTPSSAG